MNEKLRLVGSLIAISLIVIPIHLYRPERYYFYDKEKQVIGSSSFYVNTPAEASKVRDAIEWFAATRGFPKVVDGFQRGYREALEAYGDFAIELRGTGYKILYIEHSGRSNCVQVRLFVSQFETSNYVGLFYGINSEVKKALGKDVKVNPDSGCGEVRDEVLD